MKQKKIWASLHPFYETGAIMGRGIANEDFLRALLKFNPYDEYHFYLSDQKQVDILKGRLQAEFPGLPLHFDIQYNLPNALRQNNFHVFHLSDWLSGYVPLASLRNALSKEIFPVTGIIHSLSYARYHRDFLEHLWEGCTSRDAIVVSSQAGKEVMEKAFSLLRKNYSLPANFKQPQLTQIPLGVGGLPDETLIKQERLSMRQELNLSEDSVMLLYMGRISHYSKMDFLPLFRALQRVLHIPLQRDVQEAVQKDVQGAAQQEGELALTPSRIQLVLAGWNEPDDNTPHVLGQMAKSLGINFTLVSRPNMQERSRLYSAADIFVTPSDNLQETFGITILEAGAYGLPVLASDFDGYRDTIVQGETGFMAQSIGPRTSALTDRLAHVWFDNQYHLQLAQQTAVNVLEMAEYLYELINNKALRLKMGQAGRKRVEALFTWDKIIPQYVEMWENLRSQPVPEQLASQMHPAQLPYAQLFAGHFSSTLADDTLLRWSKAGEALYRGFEAPVFYAGVEKMLPPDVQKELLRGLMFQARKPVTVGDLLKHLQGHGQIDGEMGGLMGEEAEFIILWALKHDFLELV